MASIQYQVLPGPISAEPVKVKNDPVNITQDQFKQIFGSRADTEWYNIFKKYTDENAINTIYRLSAFLAQVSVETSKLAFLVENLNYSADGLVTVFPKYFQSKERANTYARQPEKIANRVYANRMANGDEASGDGWRYRGRGCIQLTGKYNYEACTRGGVPCMGENADYLTTKEGAVRSACWFWKSKGLNAIADKADFSQVCRVVNGGKNGWKERVSEYQRILQILTGLNPRNQLINPDPSADKGQALMDPEPPIDDNTPTRTPNSPVNFIVEPIVEGRPLYPWNKAFESRSGHIIEIDDTPDRERLHWYHRSGTYTEFHPQGDRVEKTYQKRYVFSEDNQESVKGSSTHAYGQWYTKTDGTETHVSAQTTFNSDGPFSVNAPVGKFSGVIDGEQLIVSFIKVRQDTKFGNVQDLKARQAVFADKSGGLGVGLQGTLIRGVFESSEWVYAGEGAHMVGKLAGYVPIEIADGDWGIEHSDTEGLMSWSSKGLKTSTTGDLKQSVNGSVLIGTGGDRQDVTEGTHGIASGGNLTLSSNARVVIPGVGQVEVTVRKPISVLPSAALFADGDIITVNMGRRLRNYLNNNGAWTELT